MKLKLIIFGICILLFSLITVSSETLLTKPDLTGDLQTDSRNYLDYKLDYHSLDKDGNTLIRVKTNKDFAVIQFRDKDGNTRHLITKKENIKEK